MEHEQEEALTQNWRERIRGKKVIFYNTGISALLIGQGKHLDKMYRVFEIFKRYPKVVLWWRPHPLEKSTIESMHSELSKSYQELREQFVREDIGILDESADLHRVIEISDAYYGDTSSVVNLYKKTGKPIMLAMDDVIGEGCERELFLSIIDYCVYRNSVYFITSLYNMIFEMDMQEFQIKNIAAIAREYPHTCCLKQIAVEGEDIVVYLRDRDYGVKYHICDGSVEYFDNLHREEKDYDQDKIFWTDSGVGYVVARENNAIYEIERQGDRRFIYRGDIGDHFWGVACVGRFLVVPHCDKMKISIWNMETKEKSVMGGFPEQFEIFGSNPYAGMIAHQRNLYLFPASANMVLKIDLESLSISEAFIDIKNDMNPSFAMYTCVKKRDNIVYAVFNRRNMWHIVNLDSGEVIAKNIQIDNSLKNFIIDRPIFQREFPAETTHEIILREDPWFNSLPCFIKSVIQYQKPYLGALCGEGTENIGKKIYEATKEEL